jgi:DNA helicase HerA-like ATPase
MDGLRPSARGFHGEGEAVMAQRIGSTVAVMGDTIEVLLDEEPAAPARNASPAPGAGRAAPIALGQPGSFLAIALPSGSLVGLITGARLAGFGASTIPAGSALAGRRLLDVLSIGTLRPDGTFDRGADLLPTVGADVFAIEPQALQQMYASDERSTLAIGTLSSLPGYPAKIDLDAMLSRHAAIVGQTGAGKSWTVASLLQRIATFPQASTVLLDLHGEYGRTFGPYATYISASELELPYWLMNAEELIDICIERHLTGAPLQISKFKELLQWAKEINRDNAPLGIPRITADTPVYFEFKRLLDEMQRLDTELVLVNLAHAHGPFYGMFTKTILRMQSRLSDRRFDLIFNPTAFRTSASMEALFRKILGEEQQPKKLVVLDLSQVPFEVRSSVISLVLRCLFDFTYWFKRKHGVPYPLSVFCDEAHTYLNAAEETHRASRLAAERIAKEGRKYGIGLTVITQRPREVSATILSQCNTFVCLRLSNSDDQEYVRNLLPDSMKGIVSMISTLRRGEALVVGDATMMPTRIRIDPPEPKPNSSDVSFTTRWGASHAPIDVGGVVDMWRKEGS